MIFTRILFCAFAASFGTAVLTTEEQNPCATVPACHCVPGIVNGSSTQDPCVNAGAVLVNAGFSQPGCCPNNENKSCPTGPCVRRDALVTITNGCACNLVLRSGGVGAAADVTLAPGAVGNWGGGTYTNACGKTTFRFVYAYCDGPPFPQPLLSGSSADCTCVPVAPCLPEA